VDTGAREGIYDLLRTVAAEGTSIVLVSDDLPELIGLSNRVAVVTEGRLVAIVDAPPDAKPDEHDLVALMIPGTTLVPTTTG
jgi:ABC-type sugar transport system ATPase subunit